MIMLWKLEDKYPKNAAALHGLSKDTIRAHLRALTLLIQRVKENPKLQELPIATVILHHLALSSLEARKPWQPQSHFRMMTLLMGAFSNMGVYAINIQHRYHLNQVAEWKAALKAWDLLAKEHQPVHQPAAVIQEILQAIQLQEDQEVRVFIMLLWLLAGRKGDIANLRSQNVKLLQDGRLQVFVQEGKGVRARQGMYHIPSHCPEQWIKELQDFLNSKATSKYLFRPSLKKSAEVLHALRLGNPALSCRAVRRGAAQAMAKDPRVSEETIMKITGHKCVKTLHRYLNWDQINEKAHLAAQTAARNNLAPLLNNLRA